MLLMHRTMGCRRPTSRPCPSSTSYYMLHTEPSEWVATSHCYENKPCLEAGQASCLTVSPSSSGATTLSVSVLVSPSSEFLLPSSQPCFTMCMSEARMVSPIQPSQRVDDHRLTRGYCSPLPDGLHRGVRPSVRVDRDLPLARPVRRQANAVLPTDHERRTGLAKGRCLATQQEGAGQRSGIVETRCHMDG